MNILLSLIGYLVVICSTYFLMKALGCLISFKKSVLAHIVLYIGCGLLSTMIIYIGDPMNLPPAILGFLICTIFCCEGTLLQRITIGLMIASTGLAFNALNDNYLQFFHGHFFMSEPRLVFWILIYMGIRHYAPERNYRLAPSLWKLLLILTLTPLGIVLVVILLPAFNYDAYATSLYLPLLLMAMFSFIGLLWTITVLARQQQLEEQTLLAGMNQRYYAEIKQQNFEIRRLKHDLANHLQVLQTLPEPRRDSYLQELLCNSAITNILNYCGDETVNAVLSIKANVMNSNAISFHAKVDIPQELPIENSDVCAIFSNALDNAIEACLLLPEARREITLDTSARKGLLVLSISNPTADRVPSTHMLPRTTKKDAHNHGLGLKSIREVIHRYHGNIEIQTSQNHFSLFLYLTTEKP